MYIAYIFKYIQIFLLSMHTSIEYMHIYLLTYLLCIYTHVHMMKFFVFVEEKKTLVYVPRFTETEPRLESYTVSGSIFANA
jgi:hypothetical protein